jgi:methylated-DNA-protein-cysteine methyltransferase related protein
MELEELWQVVHSIPEGRVASYGAVGAALRHPATGRMVGRWMAQSPQGVPWWRVVGHNGRFPIERRDPYLGIAQAELLRSEGVDLTANTVNMSTYGYLP